MGAWCKNTPYEYSARVPTILRVPGQIQPAYGGFAVDAIVEMLDLFPTLVEAAGLKPNSANEGKSLMPYVRGGHEQDTNVAYTQTFNVWHAPNGTQFADIVAMSMRMTGWRYTEYVAYNWSTAQPLWDRGDFGVELYAHAEASENDYDSYEHTNLAYEAQYAQMVEQMQLKLVKDWPYGPNTTQQYPGELFVSRQESLYD